MRIHKKIEDPTQYLKKRKLDCTRTYSIYFHKFNFNFFFEFDDNILSFHDETECQLPDNTGDWRGSVPISRLLAKLLLSNGDELVDGERTQGVGRISEETQDVAVRREFSTRG